MRNCKIAGYGYYLPKKTVNFGNQIRYRSNDKETELYMAVKAANSAHKNAGLKAKDIDLIVSASAVGIQPIPCTAALIHEQVLKGSSAPAMDINTTCTSFITALDTVSYMIAAGTYRNVLIVSSEIASAALLEKRQEVYELFSDGAVAMVISATKNKNQGVIASMQRTWSEDAHSTEIVGGLTGLNATQLTEENYDQYFFRMDGLNILRACTQKLPKMLEDFKAEFGVSVDDIDKVVPHQASKALPLIMKKLGIPKDKYIDHVKEYGNQVSVSVPFTLCKALEDGEISPGDKVLLCGTAAGLTSNILLMEV